MWVILPSLLPFLSPFTSFTLGYPLLTCYIQIRFDHPSPTLQLYASLSPTAGPCEAPGSGTLSQQKANSVLDKISAIRNIPLRQYAGKWDNTVGQTSPKKMQEELKKCGASNAELIWIDGSHNDMSTKPFNVDRLEWMLRQKRGNSGSNDKDTPSYAPERDENKEDEKDDNDNKKEESKNDRIKVDLSPSTDGKDSTAHKQFNTDLENKDKQDSTNENVKDDSTSSSSPASPPPSSNNNNTASSDSSSSSPSSGGKCKAKRRQRKRSTASKRSLGEEGYAHPGPVRRGILPMSESASSNSQTVKRGLTLAAIINDSQKEMKVQKSTPLESLKAHAGSRRSHDSLSTNVKLSRRASR